MSDTEADLQRDIAARRTFAIISHPDAGKTTMTEKLLLLGSAIQVAGSVKGKRGPHPLLLHRTWKRGCWQPRAI